MEPPVCQGKRGNESLTLLCCPGKKGKKGEYSNDAHSRSPSVVHTFCRNGALGKEDSREVPRWLLSCAHALQIILSSLSLAVLVKFHMHVTCLNGLEPFPLPVHTCVRMPAQTVLSLTASPGRPSQTGFQTFISMWVSSVLEKGICQSIPYVSKFVQAHMLSKGKYLTAYQYPYEVLSWFKIKNKSATDVDQGLRSASRGVPTCCFKQACMPE
jgi:hypothetical protein